MSTKEAKGFFTAVASLRMQGAALIREDEKMKTWTMPRVNVEGFAANEYVAACTVSGGNIIITCESHCKRVDSDILGRTYLFQSAEEVYSGAYSYTHSNYSSPNYSFAVGDPCPGTMTIPFEAWSKNHGNGQWYDSNGEASQGPNSYYVHRKGLANGKYIYYFDIPDGSGYASTSNHFILGGANPES